MATSVIIILALVVAWSIIEDAFCPRIDVTNGKDVLLWYNNSGRRDCILLFKLK